MNGLNRRPDGGAQFHSCTASGAIRQTRSAVERTTPSNERDIADTEHGGFVNGPPFALPGISDGSSTFSGMASHWGFQGRVPSLGAGGIKGSPWIGFQRALYQQKFRFADKWEHCVVKTKRDNATKLMATAEGHGLPFTACTESASPAKAKLVSRTMEKGFVDQTLHWFIEDKAYNSYPLNQELSKADITEMIAPPDWDERYRIVCPFVDTSGAGTLNASLLGCITSEGSSHSGNIISKTFMTSLNSPKPSTSSNICESASSRVLKKSTR